MTTFTLVVRGIPPYLEEETVNEFFALFKAIKVRRTRVRLNLHLTIIPATALISVFTTLVQHYHSLHCTALSTHCTVQCCTSQLIVNSLYKSLYGSVQL